MTAFFTFLSVGGVIGWLASVFYIWKFSDTSGLYGEAERNLKIACVNIGAAAFFLTVAAVIRLAT